MIIYQNQLKSVVDKAFLGLKNSILRLYDGAKKTLKGDVEAEAEKENQEEEEDVDLMLHENEIALKGAYRSFVIPGIPKTDSYFGQTKDNHDPMGEMEKGYNTAH